MSGTYQQELDRLGEAIKALEDARIKRSRVGAREAEYVDLEVLYKRERELRGMAGSQTRRWEAEF